MVHATSRWLTACHEGQGFQGWAGPSGEVSSIGSTLDPGPKALDSGVNYGGTKFMTSWKPTSVKQRS